MRQKVKGVGRLWRAQGGGLLAIVGGCLPIGGNPAPLRGYRKQTGAN
jgi:hypothetical protein